MGYLWFNWTTGHTTCVKHDLAAVSIVVTRLFGSACMFRSKCELVFTDASATKTPASRGASTAVLGTLVTS